MNKSVKLPLIVFLIGMIVVIVGALFKIQHWVGASLLLSLGLLLQAGALLILVLNLLKERKNE